MTYQHTQWRRTELEGQHPLYDYERLVTLLIAGLQRGLSCKALADFLNAQGTRTPTRKQWHSSDVSDALTCLRCEHHPDAVHPDNNPPETVEALGGYLSEIERALGDLQECGDVTDYEVEVLFTASAQSRGSCNAATPHAAISGDSVLLTEEAITAGATNRFGWNYQQLAVLGVRLPPCKGWKKALFGKYISRERYERFLRLSSDRKKQLRSKVARVLH